MACYTLVYLLSCILTKRECLFIDFAILLHLKKYMKENHESMYKWLTDFV